jgi:hypothetical protein
MIPRKNAAIALDDEQQYIYVFGDDIPPPGPCSACASRAKVKKICNENDAFIIEDVSR